MKYSKHLKWKVFFLINHVTPGWSNNWEMPDKFWKAGATDFYYLEVRGGAQVFYKLT